MVPKAKRQKLEMFTKGDKAVEKDSERWDSSRFFQGDQSKMGKDII